jgi:hypothetical protein
MHQGMQGHLVRAKKQAGEARSGCLGGCCGGGCAGAPLRQTAAAALSAGYHP